MEVTGFGGRGEYTTGHIQLWLKNGLISSLTHFHVVKIEVSYQCMKGKLNGKMIRIAANPLPFEQAEAHLLETMFYNQWAPSGESLVSKPQGTFVSRWEDIQSDPKPDLRKLLSQKKKRKEAPTIESEDTPQYVKVRGPDSRIVYKL